MSLGGPELLIVMVVVLGLPLLVVAIVLLVVRSSRSGSPDAPPRHPAALGTDHRPPPPAP